MLGPLHQNGHFFRLIGQLRRVILLPNISVRQNLNQGLQKLSNNNNNNNNNNKQIF